MAQRRTNVWCSLDTFRPSICISMEGTGEEKNWEELRRTERREESLSVNVEGSP